MGRAWKSKLLLGLLTLDPHGGKLLKHHAKKGRQRSKREIRFFGILDQSGLKSILFLNVLCMCKINWAWWYTSIISALEGRQEDSELKGIFRYIVSSRPA